MPDDPEPDNPQPDDPARSGTAECEELSGEEVQVAERAERDETEPGDPDLRGVTVSDVRMAVPARVGVEAGMVTLREEDEPYRELGIVIGQPEARAISAAWNEVAPLRPLPWDLVVSAVALLGGSLEAAVVTAVEEGRHFYAELWLHRAGEKLVLASRPSDAIAIALRSSRPIYVHKDVLDQVAPIP